MDNNIIYKNSTQAIVLFVGKAFESNIYTVTNLALSMFSQPINSPIPIKKRNKKLLRTRM